MEGALQREQAAHRDSKARISKAEEAAAVERTARRDLERRLQEAEKKLDAGENLAAAPGTEAPAAALQSQVCLHSWQDQE